MMVEASLIFSSSDLPDGLLSRSIKSRFSASAAAARRTYSSAFLASSSAASLRICSALGMSSSMPGMIGAFLACCGIGVRAKLSFAPFGPLIHIKQFSHLRGHGNERGAQTALIPSVEATIERATSSDGPASSAVLPRAGKRHGRADGGDGDLPDRHRTLGWHALLEAAQPPGTNGAQVAEASVRDRGRAGHHLALYAHAHFLGGRPSARDDRLARFRHAAAEYRRLGREDRRRRARRGSRARTPQLAAG